MEVNLLDYIDAMQSTTRSFMAPLVQVVDCGGEKAVRVNGMAVFKKDKMVGVLSEDETRGVLWVLGKVSSAAINVEIAGGIASIEVLSAQGSATPVVSDGKVTMKVSVSANAKLTEQTCEENLETIENMKKMQGAGTGRDLRGDRLGIWQGCGAGCGRFSVSAN